MKLTQRRDFDSLTWSLELSPIEQMPDLIFGDDLLLKECEKSEKISDKLLALELIVRRNEEMLIKNKSL